MEPIVLEGDDTFVQVANSCYVDEHSVMREGSVIGQHDVCGGHMWLLPVTKSTNVILCKRCHKRIEVPKEVDRFIKLREWCKKKEWERKFGPSIDPTKPPPDLVVGGEGCEGWGEES